MTGLPLYFQWWTQELPIKPQLRFSGGPLLTAFLNRSSSFSAKSVAILEMGVVARFTWKAVGRTVTRSPRLSVGEPLQQPDVTRVHPGLTQPWRPVYADRSLGRERREEPSGRTLCFGQDLWSQDCGRLPTEWSWVSVAWLGAA